ncbi:hypothetical protein Nepgr_022275 [Nepenthes gracilis]|uniref:Uncharacterized protein n=1 Tax=Nepenthes gracilis TaxID=150966 RepID=A0AAD3T0K9_NEPGR|nr:hypothetical protein Nepgr_022275 [Nepenthes gracilis]
MEDEAEIFMGSRAEFPLTFGKRPKAQTPLAALHNATRRPANEPNLASVLAPASASSSSSKSFVSLSSSSKAWLDSLRSNTKPKTSDFSELGDQPSNSTSKISVLEGDGALVCSLRPMMSTMNQEEEDEAMDAKTGPQVYSSEDDDREMIGPPPPPVDSVTEDEEEGMIGPPRPPEGLKMGDSEEDDEADDEEDENRYQIPMSNEIVLKGPSKVVSALAVDPTGSRVLSGSYDYTVHMYDFQGMNSKLASFRQLEPFEGHQVRALSWSPTAGFFLCVTGSAQAKIYDRDGLTIGEFMKGDMYIRDLKNTKGHISGITCGEWHPKTKETILTSSEDGSLRIWDVNDFKSQKQVIKPKLARPGRVPVTTCAWNRDGKCIAGGIGDGSIQIWNLKAGWGSRPDVYVENAHSDDITGLKFSSDGRHLFSRSFDSTLKVWDLRKMKLSLKEFEELPNHYAQTNIAFSPDEQLILTGTSVEKDSSAGGLLCFYDREKLELVSRVGISVGSSVVQCAWHPKLNQVDA